MFEGRKQTYSVESPIYTKDAYNYDKKSYEDQGTARIYIVVEDRTQQNVNDFDLYEGTLVGYTDDTSIGKGWRIDGKYIVKSVLPHRTGLVLYLKEYEDGNSN